ncbi:MAG: hypothetical protein IT467_01665 [Dokdonella sp.]|uniref:hypothetical protein n=1 Tax=Dokdonella sp. TaxID=2291710 RepID=UPI0025BBF987|nr:hypothetical protein [Dokdonella sp.]MBZ0223647.1 hypothetical protein [Dokdonella sp.]MCC7254615.1 hypothetical protein [Dokdonella sp.]
MRKNLSLLVLIAAAALALGACDQNKQPEADKAAAEQAPVVLPVPTNATDKAAWKKYLVSVVTANMQGVKSTHPYMYFVPAGDDEAAVADRANQLDNVKIVVARGVLPGNMMAFGGPDSAKTAQLAVDSFKDAAPGSFKEVVVLFIGAPADFEAVKAAVTAAGGEARFVEAK